MFKKAFIAHLFCTIFCSQAMLAAASAITVPPEMLVMADGAKAEAARLAEERRAAAELETAKATAARTELLTGEAKSAEVKAEAALDEAELKLSAAETKVKAVKLAAEAAAARLTKAEAAAIQAANAAAAAKTAAALAQIAADQAAAAAWQIDSNEAIANEVPVIDEARIDELAAKADAAAARIDAAYAKADVQAALADLLTAQADIKAGLAAQMADAKDEAADANLEAQYFLTAAKEELADAQINYKDASIAVTDAKLASSDAALDEASAKRYVAELMMPAPVIRGPLYYETKLNYYHWHGNKGQSGYQLINPYSFYYADNKMEYGLYTAYAITQNNTLGWQGRVAAWTDTELSLAHTNNSEQFPIRYSLGLKLPTGKTGLSETQQNAAMDEDLVALNSFGEGFEITPGIGISHKVGKQDTWALGTRYGLRGGYNLYGLDAEAGNVWSKMFSWQHAGPKWQMAASLSHHSYTTGKIGNDRYRQGDELDAALAYNKKLAPDKSILLYYRYTHDQPYETLGNTPDFGGTRTGHYSGFRLSKDLGERHTLRFTGDFMKRSGNTYDPHTDLMIEGRTKYTAGLGYDISLNTGNSLSIDLQRFRMSNQGVDQTKANYTGYNVFLRYNDHF